MASLPLKIYEKWVLDHPGVAISLAILTVLFFAYHVPQFRLDASSDSLALENDQAVKYYRAIRARYGSDDILIITYSPKEKELFESDILADLGRLRDGLAGLERVESVTSILDVPLIESPPVTLQELSKGIRTLAAPGTDQGLAKIELMSSPLYGDLLMSRDGQTTAVLVSFYVDSDLEALRQERDRLREKELEASLTVEEKRQLEAAARAYSSYYAEFQDQWQHDIADVRSILEQHQGQADIFLGGVPMIVADSIDFIARDLRTFGAGIMVFLIVFLALIFRRIQWVLLPMVVCVCVGISVIGFLGLANWPVTIVSSNFISLLLIFTLSFSVHQIVRYRECVSENPDADQRALVGQMVRTIGVPCFYMVFTTIVAFGSLVVSGIRPVIDFGWMMAIGLTISFILSFTLFPAVLMLLKPEPQGWGDDVTSKVTLFFARLVQRRGRMILVGFFAVVILSVWGMSFLYVQNRFIDYYKEDTEIYRGMEVIDRKLGGTTPLDIVIDAPQDFLEFQKEEEAMMAEDGFGLSESSPILSGYWFSGLLLEDIARIHEYLDGLPETGKVLSLHTTAQLLRGLGDVGELDRFFLGVLYNKLPEDMKGHLFSPYISNDGNQLRFSVRVFESTGRLDRQTLLEKIHNHLTTELGIAAEQVQTTGVLVLYNNVLQSLFRSQISTVGVVFVTMFVIFLLLFRNLKVAAVAIVPNITITAMVLGAMGWMNIPLDIMTITIAAICFGTADDNTIHYVHRMGREFKKHGSYERAIEQAHTTIGRAVYYTGITVMLGFSILATSNFVPTIYFGLLTAFSMMVALMANLVLLPRLIMLFEPFGHPNPATSHAT